MNIYNKREGSLLPLYAVFGLILAGASFLTAFILTTRAATPYKYANLKIPLATIPPSETVPPVPSFSPLPKLASSSAEQLIESSPESSAAGELQ